MNLPSVERCACGQPLHYSDPVVRSVVSALVVTEGAMVSVTVRGRTWLVPRHFIALHGLKAEELSALAVRYGFLEKGPSR